MIYVAVARPFSESKVNKQELMNEVMVFLTSFFLLLYSDMVLENHRSDKVQEKVVAMEKLMVIGWANIGFIGFILVVNFSIMSYETVRTLI